MDSCLSIRHSYVKKLLRQLGTGLLKFIVTVLYEYVTFRIGALIGLLILGIFIPELFLKYGFLLLFGSLLFGLLWHLNHLSVKGEL